MYFKEQNQTYKGIPVKIWDTLYDVEECKIYTGTLFSVAKNAFLPSDTYLKYSNHSRNISLLGPWHADFCLYVHKGQIKVSRDFQFSFDSNIFIVIEDLVEPQLENILTDPILTL